jgi:hypothetical protein
MFPTNSGKYCRRRSWQRKVKDPLTLAVLKDEHGNAMMETRYSEVKATPYSAYDMHMRRGCEDCRKTGVMIFPKPSQKYCMSNWCKCTWSPYVVYADYESFLIAIGNLEKHLPASVALILEERLYDGTRRFIAEHMIHCTEEYSPERLMFEMRSQIMSWRNVLVKKLNIPEGSPQYVSLQETLKRAETTLGKEPKPGEVCWVCHKAFSKDKKKPGLNPCLDHEHTAEFVNWAHTRCNTSRRYDNWNLPVIFHNGGKYDTHLLLNHISSDDFHHIEILRTGCKYLQVTLDRKVQFNDSFCHMTSSMEKIVDSQKDTPFVKSLGLKGSNVIEKMRELSQDVQQQLIAELKREFPRSFDRFEVHYPGKPIWMLIGKGFFPYKRLTSEDSWTLPISELSKEDFYNDLKEVQMSDADWEFLQDVIREFELRTLKDLHDLYLRQDIYLLDDTFEKYRATSMTTHKLDPAWFVSNPAWCESALLLSIDGKYKVDLMYNAEVYKAFKIRGGICTPGDIRYHHANNPLSSKWDQEKPTTWIVYLDCNSLYPAQLLKMLANTCPHLLQEIWSVDELIDKATDYIHAEAKKGYWVVVDWEVPKELHDFLNAYPLLVEQRNISLEMYSESMLKRAKAHCDGELKIDEKGYKLLPNLFNKKRYGCHILLAKLAIEMGYVVKEVHEVWEFDQEPWCTEFIQRCVNERQANKDDSYLEQAYKRVMCQTQGKFYQDQTKRTTSYFYNDKEHEKIARAVSRNSFDYSGDVKRFEHGIEVQVPKAHCKMNKPTYIGACLLDMSKWEMGSLWYRLMKHYGHEKLHLIFTDTDSFCFAVETESWEADMQQHFADVMDLENSKVPGLFKPEWAYIEKACILRPKLYSLYGIEGLKMFDEYMRMLKENRMDDASQFYNAVIKGKGIPSHLLKSRDKLFNMERFEGALFKNEATTVKGIKQIREVSTTIQSTIPKSENKFAKSNVDKSRFMATVSIDKKALSSLDDKRYHMEPDFDAEGTWSQAYSVAHGHWRTRLPEVVEIDKVKYNRFDKALTWDMIKEREYLLDYSKLDEFGRVVIESVQEDCESEDHSGSEDLSD